MPPESAGQAVLHDWSGFWSVVRIGGVDIPTYHLIISLALCASVFYLNSRARSKTQGSMEFKTQNALDLAILIMAGGFLGARLFHILFEAPAYYFHDPVQVMHIERGGFVWYGGVIGGTGAGFLFLHFKHLSPRPWLDLLAPVIALGYGLGRLACVVTGCCFGDICLLVPGYPLRYPTQLFAVLWELSVFVILINLERRWEKIKSVGLQRPGAIFAVWLILHAIGRLFMEFMRADDRGPKQIGLSISTWISFVLIVIGLYFFVKTRGNLKPRADTEISSSF